MRKLYLYTLFKVNTNMHIQHIFPWFVIFPTAPERTTVVAVIQSFSPAEQQLPPVLSE